MRRHADTLFLLAVFCVSTALLVWLLDRIIHDGALSLGVYLDTRARGPVFRASAILFLATASISTGYGLITTLRDFLRDRRLKRINKSRNA
jgi:ABC-type protease/lipase transport system fused ATPase/permease subunit